MPHAVGSDGGWGLDGGASAALGVAQRARVLAEQVRASSALLRHTGDGRWSGPAATTAARAQTHLAARLDRCAAQLDDVAGVAVAHARTAEHRAGELEELARQAHELIDDVAGVLP